MQLHDRNYFKIVLTSVIFIAITIALYLISMRDYLLFHGTVELFSIAVALLLFILAWNTRKFNTNSYIEYLGIAFLFIAILDLIHTLAYKGMNVIPGYDANLPTQLWIASRYLQSISFVIASYVIGKRIRINYIITVYALVTLIVGTLIFLRIFPVCFVEGIGLTTFKKVSEYIISVLLLFSLWRLHKKRSYFESKIRWMIYLAIIFSIFSEISFTFYISVYGLSNFIGHILQLFAFYLLYRAIIVTGLQRPYSILFRDLENSEKRYHELFDKMQVAFALHEIVTDKHNKPIDYIFVDVNPAFEQMTDLKKEEIIGKRVTRVLPGTDRDPADWIGRYGKVALEETEIRFENYSQPIGKWFSIVAYSTQKGYFATLFVDITQRKKNEERIQNLKERLKTASSILRHDITNDLVVVQSAVELYRDERDEGMLDEIDKRIEKLFDKIAMQKEHEDYLEEYMELDEINIKKVLQDIAKNYKNIDITIKGDGKVYADRAVNSVIENIIENAIQHGDANRIDIDIANDEKYCNVNIADNGEKIPDEIKENIFDKGFHFGLKGHTGIGLYIVRKTMEEFGGEVYVEDNQPKGTVIILKFRKVVEKDI